MTEKITAQQAIKQLLAIRALSGIDAKVQIHRRSSSKRKIVHVCLQDATNDTTYCWKRKLGGCEIEVEDYRKHHVKLHDLSKRRKWTIDYEPSFGEGIGPELASITRRAYVPHVVTQLYHPNPLLSALTKKPNST